MPNIAHYSLTDPNIHEPKGIATAAANNEYISDGAGSGNWKLRLGRYVVALTPVAVAANSIVEQSFTVTGYVAATDNAMSVTHVTAQAGLGIVGVRGVSDNVIAITYCNHTGSSITPTAENYYFFVYRV